MLIINKTSQVQELRVYDHTTKRYYSIYVGAGSNAEIHRSLSVPDLNRLVKSGVFQVVGAPTPKLEESKDITSPVVEEETTPEVEISEEVISEDNDPVVDTPNTEETPSEESEEVVSEEVDTQSEEADVTKFICEICGGEYASARGLSNHINKAHK